MNEKDICGDKMNRKSKQRMEDIGECFNWDSEANALTEAWDRGYDFCKKEMNNNFIDFLSPIKESLGDIFRDNNFCGKEWASIKLKIEELLEHKR